MNSSNLTSLICYLAFEIFVIYYLLFVIFVSCHLTFVICYFSAFLRLPISLIPLNKYLFLSKQDCFIRDGKQIKYCAY